MRDDNERRDERRIVFGAVKNAKNHLWRDRMTHGGLIANGRTVADKWPLEEVIQKEDAPNERDDEVVARQRAIIKSQIRECVRKPNHVELVERRLFQCERVSHLARELGIKEGTAYCAVRRARRYLGLPESDPSYSDPSTS